MKIKGKTSRKVITIETDNKYDLEIKYNFDHETVYIAGYKFNTKEIISLLCDIDKEQSENMQIRIADTER